MVEGRYLTEMDDLTEVKDIWKQVLLEESGWNETRLGLDDGKLLLHAVAYEGASRRPVAAGTMEYGDTVFLISNVAVLPQERRKNYGDFVLRMLVNKAVLAGGMPICAEVTENAQPLFERVGFTQDGEWYEKDGLRFRPYLLPLSQVKSCCDCKEG